MVLQYFETGIELHDDHSKHAVSEATLVHTICSLDPPGFDCEMIFALHEKAGLGFSPWEGGSSYAHAKNLGFQGVIVEEKIKRSNTHPLSIINVFLLDGGTIVQGHTLLHAMATRTPGQTTP